MSDDGTKMLRRSDVIAAVCKEMAKQWDICNAAEACGNKNRAAHTRSRIDALRILRSILSNLASFVSKDHARADAIPRGEEWVERIQLAIEATNGFLDAEEPMQRLPVRPSHPVG